MENEVTTIEKKFEVSVRVPFGTIVGVLLLMMVGTNIWTTVIRTKAEVRDNKKYKE